MRLPLAALLLAGAAPALAQAPAAPAVPAAQVREVGALVYDGIPAVPPELAARLNRYANARSAGFADWLPDGSMLIATRFGSTPQIHRMAAPMGARRQLTFYAEPVAGALAVPGATDNRFVIGRDTGGDEYYQGYVLAPDGVETAFTELRTRNQSFRFSRDGKHLAWSRVTPGDGNYDIMTMTPGQPQTRRVVLEGTGAMSVEDVSDDGRTILAGKYISAAEAELYRLDVATGRLTEINPTDGKVAYGDAELTPDGRSVLVTSDEGSQFRQLVRIDLESGRPTVLTPGLRWDVESFDLSDDGRTLAVVVNEDGLSKLTLRDFASGRELPAPTLPPSVVYGPTFSKDGRRLALTVADARGTDVWTWDLADRKLVRWTESELGGIDPNTLADAEVIRFRSFDGRSIPAIVERPKTRAAGRAPVIIDIHGGPEGQERPGLSAAVASYIGELGAVVISPNVRGSDGYGKAYLALDNAEKREDSVKDIGALLDWIATQPDLDPNRVVVTGGSYGGYMVLASLVHYSDRLAGGIDVVGISNFITFLENTEGYRRDLRRAEYGDERDPAMRAVFERISPLNNVERITKPLLVVQGDNDPRVPKSEADQVVAKIRAGGREVWYLRAKNEGHGFRKKENRDAEREVEMMFLRRIFFPGEAAG